ncbi:outer membrane protein assembly factor BamD [Lichenicola cladoniae]|uniref:Outer membrane protein assembly factor BamD n=1 Tax=Lichenicola cladoniae TaxID=1484109 RepID=A0A6M8HRF1_9PROT|nr:outer membrane protein assembly factor BamD [Lichenicola cladoniae]NPD65981.1 outer membrane protein assembly factor BamD [Acetobacteraceae bacterium]QKE91034.1 outer membrane protein assembly factor BamD [Lichenicola cladoniae]
MSSNTSHVSRLFTVPFLLALLGGCSTLDSLNPFSDSKPAPQAENVPQTPEGLYNNGIDALHGGRYKLAVTQFENIQQNFPYSGYTANAQLMEGYAYYLQNQYSDAVSQVDRFLQLHPTSGDAAYAYYLRALCYYEQIADIQRDQQGTVQAMNALQDVITRFPNTSYARDARLKIDLCRDHLAGKEMLVGRYYEGQHYYEAAINRYQRVVQDFQTTNHAAEALHRLVEVYLKLGLTDQARKTASVLGYNYPGSTWYQDSYADLRSAGALDASVSEPGQPPVPAQQRGFFGRTFHSIF